MEAIMINQITKEKKNTIVEISLRGTSRLTVVNINEVNSGLQVLAENPKTKLKLNLNGVTFIDSSGFYCLNEISEVAQQYHSHLELVNIEPEVFELIHLVRKHGQINIDNILPKHLSALVA